MNKKVKFSLTGIFLVLLATFNVTFEDGSAKFDLSKQTLMDNLFVPSATATEEMNCGICVTPDGNYPYEDPSSSFRDNCPNSC